MDHRLTLDNPAALIVSHCVPDAVGDTDRARVWELLRLVGRTHKVFLACVLDGSVHLAQWRHTSQQAHQLAIEQSFMSRRLIGHWLGWLDGRAHERVVMDTTLAQPIAQWSADYRFDTVVCTHPGLWPQARLVEARLRVCDLRLSSPSLRRRTGGHRRRQALNRSANRHLVAKECHVVTVSHQEDQHLLADKPCQTVVMPTTIDPIYFTENPAALPIAPHPQHGLVVTFHGDWKRRHSRRLLSWFERRVWPGVRRAVPNVRFRHTRPGVTDPYTALSGASVVVVPEPTARLARLPVLQALAMRRAVVANLAAIQKSNLGIHHGEQLLLSGNKCAWEAHCIKLLRSSVARAALSQSADLFAKRYNGFETATQALNQALNPPNEPARPISLAA